MKAFIIILIFFSSAHIRPQNNYDLKQFSEESTQFIKFPSRWQGEDYLKLSVVLGSTLALMQIDETIRSEMLKDRSYNDILPMTLSRYWGEPITSIGLGVFVIAAGAAQSNKFNQKLGFEIAQSFLYTGILTQFSKILIGRGRPNSSSNAYEFRSISEFNDNYWSLPSGHTSLAFSLSTILSLNTDNQILKVLYYIPAFASAFSRLYQNFHWTSDVFLGACLGFFTAKFVYDSHKVNDKKVLNPYSSNNVLSFKFNF